MMVLDILIGFGLLAYGALCWVVGYKLGRKSK
jgi:hypothetical protein